MNTAEKHIRDLLFKLCEAADFGIPKNDAKLLVDGYVSSVIDEAFNNGIERAADLIDRYSLHADKMVHAPDVAEAIRRQKGFARR